MTTETERIDTESAIIGGTETLVYSLSLDPGDGDRIMVYVDATPLDDTRRAKLATLIAKACNSFDGLVAACKQALNATDGLMDLYEDESRAEVYGADLDATSKARGALRAVIADAEKGT